jgi:AcrR family transcriptional regulator
MTRISNLESSRRYDNSLREEQAEETRGRILDAAIRVIAGGIATASVPAIAREAGVSVPTVYRHFGTKTDLLAAVYPHVARRAGLDRLPDPTSLDDLKERIGLIFERADALDALDRAAMASPAAAAVRSATMPSRLARLRRLTDAVGVDLSAADRERLTRLLAVVTASASLRMWRDHLGASVEQAAADIDFMVRALVTASQKDKQ